MAGHSGTARRGADLVCAAVSVLFRTAARLLQLQPDIEVRGRASQRGRMELTVSRLPVQKRGWLAGLTDFLVRGAEDLREENPAAIELRVIEGEDL